MKIDENYSDDFSDDSFWSKIKNVGKSAGKKILEPAFKLYYTFKDGKTPLWAKTTIVAALGYFISPIDAIPDPILVFGYTDDLGVMSAAMSAVINYIKSEHARMAQELVSEILS